MYIEYPKVEIEKVEDEIIIKITSTRSNAQIIKCAWESQKRDCVYNDSVSVKENDWYSGLMSLVFVVPHTCIGNIIEGHYEYEVDEKVVRGLGEHIYGGYNGDDYYSQHMGGGFDEEFYFLKPLWDMSSAFDDLYDSYHNKKNSRVTRPVPNTVNTVTSVIVDCFCPNDYLYSCIPNSCKAKLTLYGIDKHDFYILIEMLKGKNGDIKYICEQIQELLENKEETKTDE